ncbi:hypothetical protein E2C01_021998 [Portunus trituberculatus]|uniref:Uncharacterized protein n=1 Tax=Portunus trituberculatus TaxID=210409 RepID=A0A5B7E629_PORTR|nr:hypothetical protein [Portunus trituberculatus]
MGSNGTSCVPSDRHLVPRRGKRGQPARCPAHADAGRSEARLRCSLRPLRLSPEASDARFMEAPLARVFSVPQHLRAGGRGPSGPGTRGRGDYQPAAPRPQCRFMCSERWSDRENDR